MRGLWRRLRGASGLPELPEEVERAVLLVGRLARRWPDLRSRKLAVTVEAMIAQCDARIAAQLGEIYGHPVMQRLEGAWRGLHWVVREMPPREDIALTVMNVAKAEVASGEAELRHAAWAGVYAERKAPPIAVLLVDVAFDHADTQALTDLARLGGLAQMPVIAGAAPALLGLAEPQGLSALRDPEAALATPAHDGFAALRRAPEARYLGLCITRFAFASPGDLPRPPCPVPGEYAIAANIARSVAKWGWPQDCRGVEGGGVAGLGPTEAAIDERQESHLARAGLIAALDAKNRARAGFFSLTSLSRRDDLAGEAAGNWRVSTHLPYLMVATRYAQHILRLAADWPGPREAGFEAHIRDWLESQTDRSMQLNEAEMAQRPLWGHQFDLTGEASARLSFSPGFKLEGVPGAIELELTLPEQAHQQALDAKQ
ncbi:type VI secretion system contractile sheath large subunit [Vannielia litorea]|uniref:type VI secretion system contractile sheath domain-containing protein n=1 Tax=Vannielia litorea TaxID=1217970 RepID=UPI001C977E25|nr:type VI secretion system contractile sheath large subunit [Vannielia litorea]MBY6151678.1 type VI secretion system contractile sheath large subunit [Vannielia litorea]